jgi:hypothetical protein
MPVCLSFCVKMIARQHMVPRQDHITAPAKKTQSEQFVTGRGPAQSGLTAIMLTHR